MTNYERIKNMSIEEMAEWLHNQTSGNIPCACIITDGLNCYEMDCLEGTIKYLESEVTND